MSQHCSMKNCGNVGPHKLCRNSCFYKYFVNRCFCDICRNNCSHNILWKQTFLFPQTRWAQIVQQSRNCCSQKSSGNTCSQKYNRNNFTNLVGAPTYAKVKTLVAITSIHKVAIFLWNIFSYYCETNFPTNLW